MRKTKGEPPTENKGTSLLRFLRDAAALRRRRITSYGHDDRVMWLAHLPRDTRSILSPFLSDPAGDPADVWLEVRKLKEPPRPSLPDHLRDWVSEEDLEQADQEPVLIQRITRLRDSVPRTQSLEEHPEIAAAWENYLSNEWRPWAERWRHWREIQRVYDELDEMRRRIEAAEERYELVLAVGLLAWEDPTGAQVKRHLLTAPAEISLDADRAILSVIPHASFREVHVELDMLEPQHQPPLERTNLNELLEQLDLDIWDRERVAAVLRVIANATTPNSQVIDDEWDPPERVTDALRVAYAPALILRQPQSRAYEQLVTKLLEIAENGMLRETEPWQALVNEGCPPDPAESDDPLSPSLPEQHILLPLPTNDEQLSIVSALHRCPYVLVKGPPGTGKSHTIANLICHLLASGERVLVTAHAGKALTVLRNLLPDSIRPLCVTASGSSREDQRELEEGIRQILHRKAIWVGPHRSAEEISELEAKLKQLEKEAAKVDRELREVREAETLPHTVAEPYHGTMAQIARSIQADEGRFGWFPDAPEAPECPLAPSDVRILAEVHGQLTPERLQYLELSTGDDRLPEPSQFETSVSALKDAETEYNALMERAPTDDALAMTAATSADLDRVEEFINALDGMAVAAEGLLGEATTQRTLEDLLAGRRSHLEERRRLAANILRRLKESTIALENTRVTIEVPLTQSFLEDARRRLDYVAAGGWRGVGPLAPKVIRDTRYVEKSSLVDGQPPRTIKALRNLVAFLDISLALHDFESSWPGTVEPDSDHRSRAIQAADFLQAFLDLVTCFGNLPLPGDVLASASTKVDLARRERRDALRTTIRLERARRNYEDALRPLTAWSERISHSLALGAFHRSLDEMRNAIQAQDIAKYSQAWKDRLAFLEEKQRLSQYRKLTEVTIRACPPLESLLNSTRGDQEWAKKLLELRHAWAWAAAKKWLNTIVDRERFHNLETRARKIQDDARRVTEELASKKAWHAFFTRFSDDTRQALTAWAKAVRRIGKGTGKYAHRHRRDAAKYLKQCLQSVPAWVMPLHRVWDTVDPEPGLFDTVIVDEASQASIDALVLLLLAKRIVVVGDDQQNSPEAVGMPEDAIARLARNHLKDFRFRSEFRPDTSLYDHAERAFGNIISLREHFRCVPEIIRFSNDLCYRDAPLIPLRQPPPRRLDPLKHRFVSEGSCRGEGQRILNEAEAEAIVETIKRCLDDPAYAGKTMGVITLQGHAQAEHIDRLLAEKIAPKIREDRKLRCGVPAVFQGDERDVVFLSLVVAPNHPYRALTGLNDRRRFNVAMSRARDQVWLFHSVRESDLSRDDLRWTLVRFFTQPAAFDDSYTELDFLEREAARRGRRPGEQPAPFDSWFEVDVALEMLRRRYRLKPQVDVAGHRIDLVVEGSRRKLAIECDGEAWHGPEQYERDVARQRQLERAGWVFVRVRESEFYLDKASAVCRVEEKCAELGIRPVGQEDLDSSTKSLGAVEGEDNQEVLLDTYFPGPVEDESIHYDEDEPAHHDTPHAKILPLRSQPSMPTRSELRSKSPEQERKGELAAGSTSKRKPKDPDADAAAWFALARWGKETESLTPVERKFAYRVGRYRANGWSLSDKQRKWAEEIWEKANSRGFEPDGQLRKGSG